MSDVTLYPIRGQVAQVNGKSEYIVYVPRADKYTYGTVKIGDGILVEDGLISFDTNQIKINIVAKNGVDIVPDDEKRVNIVLEKSDVGLDNVDNTSDLDKPISNKVQEALDLLNTDLTDDILEVDDRLVAHMNDFNNPHRVTKGQVGLDKADNTADKDKPISLATQRAIDGLSNELLTVSAEVERLSDLVKGQDQALAYKNYSDVVDVFNMAATNAYRVGQTIFVNTTNVPDLWIYSVENTHVDYLYTDDEEIIDILNTHGVIQFGYYKLAQLETRKIDLDNYVRLDTYQNITGVKVFTEQIGILNGAEGEINYIKHINNNFLISSSDGENIVNIDEQLRTFNFYNKPIALEEYVDDNFISYTENQNLTDEQKEIARNNIGAGTGGASVDYATDETAGIIRIATDEEASSGSYDLVAITPRQLAVAIESSLGSVEAWLVDLNTGSGV